MKNTHCYWNIRASLLLLLALLFYISHHLCVKMPVVVQKCGTGPCTLNQQHRLRAFKNRKTLRTKGSKWEEIWEKCMVRSFTVCIPHQKGNHIKRGRDGQDMSHIWQGAAMHMGLGRETWCKRPPGRLRHRWEDNITMDCKVRDREDTDLIWLMESVIHLVTELGKWR